MKLDPRIEKLSDILACVNIEEAKQFIGQKGYFSDSICAFDTLSTREFNTLTGICDYDMAFETSDNVHYSYFIPECRLKPEPKKLKPFTIDQALKTFRSSIDMDSKYVTIRNKNTSTVYSGLLTGYTVYTANERDPSRDMITIAGMAFPLDELCKHYEYYDNNQDCWEPCGVEE